MMHLFNEHDDVNLADADGHRTPVGTVVGTWYPLPCVAKAFPLPSFQCGLLRDKHCN